MKVVSKLKLSFNKLLFIAITLTILISYCFSVKIQDKSNIKSNFDEDDIEFLPTKAKKKGNRIINDVDSDDVVKENLTLGEKWDKLFKVKRDTLVECNDPKIPLDTRKDEDKKKKEEGPSALRVPPQKAHDYITPISFGFGKSAYFYDYLDDTLMNDLVKEMTDNWTSAMAITDIDEKYADPYALATMLLGQERTIKNINPEENKKLLGDLRIIYPKFNEDVWMKSLDALKINTLLKDWKWDVRPGTINPAKKLINDYDFNGDGRLNLREFTLASILQNQKIFGDSQCKHCFSDTIKKYIDPIFHYCDCDGDGVVTSEELWKGLKLVKKSSNYNFYKCIIKNSFFRTSAVNDFMLKASVLKKGQLTADEFRRAILLGYWMRHTTIDSVVQDSSLSKRDTLRWPDGKDFSCEEAERNIEAQKAEKEEQSKRDCKMKKSLV